MKLLLAVVVGLVMSVNCYADNMASGMIMGMAIGSSMQSSNNSGEIKRIKSEYEFKNKQLSEKIDLLNHKIELIMDKLNVKEPPPRPPMTNMDKLNVKEPPPRPPMTNEERYMKWCVEHGKTYIPPEKRNKKEPAR